MSFYPVCRIWYCVFLINHALITWQYGFSNAKWINQNLLCICIVTILLILLASYYELYCRNVLKVCALLIKRITFPQIQRAVLSQLLQCCVRCLLHQIHPQTHHSTDRLGSFFIVCQSCFHDLCCFLHFLCVVDNVDTNALLKVIPSLPARGVQACRSRSILTI